MPEAGDVVLVRVPFVDTLEVKKRPALVLYKDFGNVVVAGITSNTKMRGIPLLKNEGAVKDSVIKTNYIFTTTEKRLEKTLFHLSPRKKRAVYYELMQKLDKLAV